MERNERTCKECQSEEVEDDCHWLLLRLAWDHLRLPLVEEVSHCDGFQGQSLNKQVAFVLCTACTNHIPLYCLSSMWCAGLSVRMILLLVLTHVFSGSDSVFLFVLCL